MKVRLEREEKAKRKRNIVINRMKVESNSRKEEVEKVMSEIGAQVRVEASKVLGDYWKMGRGNGE